MRLDGRFVAASFREAAAIFRRHDATRLAAALAFYAAFSLAPVLIIAIAVSGAIFGGAGARGEIFGELEGVLGISAASAVQSMVVSASGPSSSLLASSISIAALALGASAVFGELKAAFNELWSADPVTPKRGFAAFVRDRVFSFGMLAAVSFLLVVSLVANAVLAGIEKYLAHVLPTTAPLMNVGGFAVSTAVLTVLFGLIYSAVADCPLPRRAAWLGALATALLLETGEFLIGLYLGRTAVASTYGAAGSLLMVLIWVFYTAQATLFGACLAKAFANRMH